jgi:hypothetical protein
VLGRGGAPAAAAAAAANAAAEAEAAAVAAAGSAEQQVDEFGRDMGLMRRKELERGSSRRGACVDALLQQLVVMRQGACWVCSAAFVVLLRTSAVSVHMRVFAGAGLGGTWA